MEAERTIARIHSCRSLIWSIIQTPMGMSAKEIVTMTMIARGASSASIETKMPLRQFRDAEGVRPTEAAPTIAMIQIFHPLGWWPTRWSWSWAAVKAIAMVTTIALVIWFASSVTRETAPLFLVVQVALLTVLALTTVSIQIGWIVAFRSILLVLGHSSCCISCRLHFIIPHKV